MPAKPPPPNLAGLPATTHPRPDSAPIIPPHSLQKWLWILLAAGLLWRIIRYALNFPLWIDEANLALNLFDHSILDINRPLANQQISPPLFLIITQALRSAFSASEYILRLFPLITGLASLALFYRFIRQHLDPLAGLIAFAFLAISSIPVQYTTEFKSYSLDLFFGIAYLVLGCRILQNPAHRLNYLLLALLVPLSFSLSYTSVFLFGGASLTLLPTIFRRAPWPCKILYVLANLTALAFLLLLLQTVIASQQAGSGLYMRYFWYEAFPPHDWTFFPWLYHAHIHGIFAYPLTNSEFLASLTTLLALAGIAHLIARRQFSFLTLILAPFALTFLAACLHRYPYGGNVRVQQHLAPAAFTLAGLGLGSLLQLLARRFSPRHIVWVAHLLFTLLLLVPILGIIHNFRFPYLRAQNDLDARTQAALLRDRFPANTPLYMPQPIRQIPPVFAWYLRTYIPDTRLTLPPAMTEPTSPSTPPAPFALLECPINVPDPAAPPLWQRSTLLELQSFHIRAFERPVRVYLYEPPPPPSPTAPH